MYSKELMRYLLNYQKDDFKPEEKTKEIRFKNGQGSGRLAEILLTVKK